MLKKLLTGFWFFAVTGTLCVHANTLRVPADHSTIQAAINTAGNGDTVLVAPGTYYENINYRGKNIVVGSYYLLIPDNSYISSTVINGSAPLYPDSASVVLFISGEDSTAVLAGFTITGGEGTAWPDEHSSGTYREGGGILSALSSPTIRNNIIAKNHATNSAGLSGAGGGGIRAGDGNPRILNNVITQNTGQYGAGVVLNYCGVLMRNNVIFRNIGGNTYGGGGLWINGAGPAPKIIENNTIVGNHSSTTGGGVRFYGSVTATLRNNIFWANSGGQISGSSSITYTDIQGGFAGTGNIGTYPDLTDTSFYLNVTSPCIDAGNPDSIMNDPFDPGNASLTLWPSRGTVHNDMGAYGGPGRIILPTPALVTGIGVSANVLSFGTIGSGNTKSAALGVTNTGNVLMTIDSMRIKNAAPGLIIETASPLALPFFQTDSIRLTWTPVSTGSLKDTLLIYHRDTTSVNPLIVKLTATVVLGMNDDGNGLFPKHCRLDQNFPNPFNPVTTIAYAMPSDGNVRITIYNTVGQEVCTLVNGRQSAGTHSVMWNGKDNAGNTVSSGEYLYRIQAGAFLQSRKMLLVK